MRRTQVSLKLGTVQMLVKIKMQRLSVNDQQRVAIMARSCWEEERSERLLAVLEDVVIGDEKVKKNVVSSLRKIPMPDTMD